MQVSIRLAELADQGAVEAIVAAAYGHYVSRIGRRPGPMLDDYAARITEKRVHVLEDAGNIHGLVVLIAQTGAMLLDNIAVAPTAQGRGYGRRLLAFSEDFARASGCNALTLYTHELMTENQRLYARIGYVETHRAEENGFRRVYMRKMLDEPMRPHART